MANLSRAQVERRLFKELDKRFPGRAGTFNPTTKISQLGFPSKESLRTWGMMLNQAPWYKGWFTPSEFMACATIGIDPEVAKPNLTDLMYKTQGRPNNSTALAVELFTLVR